MAVPRHAVPCSPAGGLAAVIYTDTLQTLIMVLGAIVLAVKGKSWGSTDPPARGSPSARFEVSEINKKTQSKQFGGQDAQQGFGL